MIASLVFILGVVFGSFFNVVIYRVPLEKSIAKGRSMCPSCGHVLTSVELIPVVSIIMNTLILGYGSFFVAGAILLIATIFKKFKFKLKEEVPFGPAMSIMAVILYFWGGI